MMYLDDAKLGDVVIDDEDGKEMVIIEVDNQVGLVWCQWTRPSGLRQKASFMPEKLTKKEGS